MNFRFDKKTDSLFEAVSSLENKKEAEAFFRDLCSIEEIKNMSLRWEIAKMIARGYSAKDITSKLDVSEEEISKVNLWINNGEDGYRAVLKKMGFKNCCGPIFPKEEKKNSAIFNLF